MSEGGESTGFFERVDARWRELGIRSERDLSIRVTGGADFIRDLRRKGHLPKGENLDRLAIELRTTTDWLLGRADSPEQVRSEVALAERRSDYRSQEQAEGPPIPVLGTGDCADLVVSDDTGALVSVEQSSFDPDYHVRYIQRPRSLRGSKDIYAIRFQGDSMMPRFEPEEIGIVDPRRPIQRGDYVLVQLRAEGTEDVVSVLAKRFLRQTDTDYVLEQLQPPLVFTLPKAHVARVHKILRQGDYLY